MECEEIKNIRENHIYTPDELEIEKKHALSSIIT